MLSSDTAYFYSLHLVSYSDLKYKTEPFIMDIRSFQYDLLVYSLIRSQLAFNERFEFFSLKPNEIFQGYPSTFSSLNQVLIFFSFERDLELDVGKEYNVTYSSKNFHK